MKLHIITLALDAMPFITRHLSVFEESELDFTWHIIEGAAENVGSTKWCQPQRPRLSRDGTSEYLNSIVSHPRVKLYRRQFWKGGKDMMVNMPLIHIREQCTLLQVDSDEIWKPWQVCKISELFEQNLLLDQMIFQCRYFVGRDIVINIENELRYKNLHWPRAWRFQPGMRFISHEPPVLMPHPRRAFSAHETHGMNLIFDHFSYAIESQVDMKSRFYGYVNAVTHWRRLQANTIWPVKLKDFLPWANEHSIAERIIEL